MFLSLLGYAQLYSATNNWEDLLNFETLLIISYVFKVI